MAMNQYVNGLIITVLLMGFSIPVMRNPSKNSPELDSDKKYICNICYYKIHCPMSYTDDCTDQFFNGDNEFIAKQCCPGSIKEVK
jgi:hypothetical protein